MWTRGGAPASSRLERALGTGRLVLHYQPKVELATGAVPGVEALVRFRAPGLAPRGAAEVLEAVEAAGLGNELTDWVIDRALRQRVAWAQAGLRLQVAVNASPDALLSPGFVDGVAQALRRHRTRGPALIVEVTEGALIRGHDVVAAALGRLRTLGVGLSIDDFGTGWSSLARLRRLPFDEVKVDREFVAGIGVDEDDRAIVRTILDLARHLDRRVVAEGVEDGDQLAWLAALGCDAAQGHHLTRPLPASELAGWVRTWHQGGHDAAPSVDRPGRPRDAQRLALRRLLGEAAAAGEATTAEDLLSRLAEALGWPVAALWVVDDADRVLRCAAFVARRALASPDFERQSRSLVFARDRDLPGAVWASGEARWLDDAGVIGPLARSGAARRAGLRGAVAVPVRPDGRTIGVIELYSGDVEPPDEALLDELAGLAAGGLGVALWEARAREAADAHRRAADTVARAHELLAADLTAADARATLCEALLEIAGATTVALWEPRADELAVTAHAGRPVGPLRVPLTGETSATVAAYRSGRSAFIARVAGSPAVSPRLARLIDAASALFAPVVRGDETVAAVSVIWSQQRRRPHAPVRRAIDGLLDHAAPVLHPPR